nr:lipocalin family protein [Pedobacter panaciterrae]
MGSEVVGKWLVEDAVEIDYENGVEVFRADMFALSGAYLEFKEDGNGCVCDGEAGIDAFTYTATEQSVVLKYADGEDTTTYYINELTNSTLSVYEEYMETYDGIVHKEVVEIKLKNGGA